MADMVVNSALPQDAQEPKEEKPMTCWWYEFVTPVTRGEASQEQLSVYYPDIATRIDHGNQ